MNCTKETVTMTSADLVKAGGIKYTTDAVGNYVYSTPKAQDMCVYGFVDPIFLTLKFNVDISGEIHIKRHLKMVLYLALSSIFLGTV